MFTSFSLGSVAWLAHLYVFEAVTKLKIVQFESQDVVVRFRLDHNL